MAVIDGDASDNSLTGTDANDRIRGFAGNDWLYGLAGDDRLEGGSGWDHLYGGDGADLLIGGRGRDIIEGGAGPDTFRFDDEDAGDVTAGPLSDVILDFSDEDVIDLTAVDLLGFWGGGGSPERGAFSIWQADGNTYVTWNTFGGYHDIELTGYTGDPYSRIRWYEDDFSADVNTGGRLSSGGSVEGTIEQTEDRDWFQVTLEEGQLYTFDLRGAASGGGTLGDPYLALYDADGNFVMDDYDGSGTSDARLVFHAESPETYYISADGTGYTTGTYALELTARAYVDDFAGNTGTTGTISAGEIRAGEIGHSLDQDWFQVTFEAGQIYTFDLRGEAGGGGTLGDPHLVLYDVDGNFVTEDYDGSGTPDARLTFYAQSAGSYFISADGTGYTTGTYELELGAQPYVDDFAGDASTTGVIAAGETITGEIGIFGDQDWIRIDLTEGEAYAFDLRGSPSGSGTLPDPVLELYDASGSFIDGNDDWKDFDSHLAHTAVGTGTYYLAARAFADGYTGTYSLSVQSGGQVPVTAADDLLLAM